MRPQHKTTALAWVFGLLFVAGMTQLFLLRFETGDVYPPYSSLRADPLGSRALFDSLNLLSAQTAQRNYRPLDKVVVGAGNTLLVLGVDGGPRVFENPLWQRTMDRLEEEGGRLVLAFRPAHRAFEKKEKDSNKDSEDKDPYGGIDDEDADSADDEEKEDSNSSKDEKDRWDSQSSLGFQLYQAEHVNPEAQAVRTGPGPDVLPSTVAHRAPLSFELHDDAWETFYAWDGEPVVVARAWGNGTLVMAADSYLFSNESLRRTPSADLMAWFLGPHRGIVFDEFHHGVSKRPGIANLARKYRLHGLFATLLIIALLFVWRRASVFIPPSADAAQQPERDSAYQGSTSEGMVNLMQQHIDSKQLLPVCHNAWRASAAKLVPDSLKAKVENLVEIRAGQDPVTLYCDICKLLEQGKRL